MDKALAVGTGLFVTFEGGEGAGKSTQIRLLADTLASRGYEVVVTREPGGSPGAEAVRHHIEEVIRPALMKGAVVLCDRFMDSSRVYQGVTGNLEPQFMETLERVAVNGVIPDCTIIFDMPASAGLARARHRSVEQAESTPDRFEKEEIEMHEKRREAFLDIAASDPLRCRVVDARGSKEEIAAVTFNIVEPLLPIRKRRKKTTEDVAK